MRIKLRTLFAVFLLPISLSVMGEDVGTSDPLDKAGAYSLEISDDLTPTESVFPLGILSDRDFKILGPMGFNFTEHAHCCYEFKDGKECNFKCTDQPKGLCFFCCWSAHTLYRSYKTKNYGELQSAVNEKGKPVGHQYICLFDEPTKKYVLDCERHIVKTVLERGAAVGIWGIDNEWESPLDYSPQAVAAFYSWLKDTYKGDLAKLNQAWGTELKDFNEAVPPVLDEFKTRPGAWLDWRSFQEGAYTDFIAERFKTIQEQDPKHRPVVSKSTQCTIEMTAVAKKKANNHGMLAAKVRDSGKGWYGIDMYGHGDRNCYEFDFLYNCVLPDNPAKKKHRYGIFTGETNNHAGPGWQFAETYWRSLGNGLKGATFFTMGFFGAQNDWATFAFTDPVNGERRGRFYYAARLASMIHRSEKFWAQAVPSGATRIAMLVPHRDIMLSENTGRSYWDYPTNSRLNVYKWLRDQGYWVEAIPYSKLNPEFMKRYQALVLVNAEHLSAEESGNIRTFVENGGVLLADTRPGLFDEHHIMVRGLDELLGVELGNVDKGIDLSPDDRWYRLADGNLIRTDGRIRAVVKTAKLLNDYEIQNSAKEAWVTENKVGKGTAYWFNTRLGVLRAEDADDRVVSGWLAGFLKRSGVEPCLTVAGDVDFSKVRVEEPQKDSNGNCALIVANNTSKPISGFSLSVVMPGDDFKAAYWAPAESTGLQPISIRQEEQGVFMLSIPSITSAGIVYLFKDHAPLLGINPTTVKAHPAADQWTPLLKPGRSQAFDVQIVNPKETDKVSGTITVKAPKGWTVSPATMQVDSLNPGELRKLSFVLRVPEQADNLIANRLNSVVVSFNEGGKQTALCHSPVALDLDKSKYACLLSDNAGGHDDQRFFVTRTGMTYKYEFPTPLGKGQSFGDPASNKSKGQTGNALNNGIKWWNRIASFKNIQDVDIIFDLKKSYNVTSLKVGCSRAQVPESFEVLFGKNETDFSNVVPYKATWTEEHGLKWAEIPIKDIPARYVKLHVKFPKTGGYLDEVQIWGKEAAK